MNIIIGLGNPGSEYESTRHNVGMTLIQLLVGCLNLTEKYSKKYKYYYSSTESNFGDKTVLIRPCVYMNSVGIIVQKIIAQYNLYDPTLWIIYDDLDISLGHYKIQYKKGPKKHKGLLSIYKNIKEENIWHVRIGVDNRDKQTRIPGEVYVLQRFSKDEIEELDKVFDSVIKDLRQRINV